jgi:hypothetical protein
MLSTFMRFADKKRVTKETKTCLNAARTHQMTLSKQNIVKREKHVNEKKQQKTNSVLKCGAAFARNVNLRDLRDSDGQDRHSEPALNHACEHTNTNF